MDPGIAANVSFTNKVNDLTESTAHASSPRGSVHQHTEPKENENQKIANPPTKDELTHVRQKISEGFPKAISEWIEAAKSKKKTKLQATKSQRAYLAERLRVEHWKLDPNNRARLCLDRERVHRNGRKIDLFPKDEGIVETKSAEVSNASEVEPLESVNSGAAQTAVAQTLNYPPDQFMYSMMR
ncbi:hypothetical protein N7523_008338 [Penicillium sp. IBT 18751x]|nr:hypothetical protein N7523_008338 [Penicillium sp. IBT 18751x]